MPTATKCIDLIEQFVESEYGFKPNITSISIVINSGMERALDFFHDMTQSSSEDPYDIPPIIPQENTEYNLEDIIEQFRNVEYKIGSYDFNSSIAKLIALSLPYNIILESEDHELIKNWSQWLGVAENKVGDSTEDREIRRSLFRKGLEHHLISREHGDETIHNAFNIAKCQYKLNMYEEALPVLLEAEPKSDRNRKIIALIGAVYFKLEDYENAIDYFIEAREMGSYTRGITGMLATSYRKIGEFENAILYLNELEKSGRINEEKVIELGYCHFMLGHYDEGLSYFEYALELMKEKPFKAKVHGGFDNKLKKSFIKLESSKDGIPQNEYEKLRDRFTNFYKELTDFWKEIDPDKIKYRIEFDKDHNLFLPPQTQNNPARGNFFRRMFSKIF